jgi:hypothetical protein
MSFKADIWFAQLGWTVLRGKFAPVDGPVEFRVVAPWCPDCEEWGPRLTQGLPVDGRPVVLVGEFATPEAVLAFADRFWPAGFPVLHGTREKSEIARIQARFRQVRAAFGDVRKWGVPSVIQGQLFNGRLLVENLFDPTG